MLFNSWSFAALLFLSLALYYLPLPTSNRRGAWQIGVLLLTSAVFYAWEEPRFLILLGASVILNAVSAERIVSALSSDAQPYASGAARARTWLIGSIVANLLFLSVFKYGSFFVAQLPAGWAQHSSLIWLSALPLPIGISFYTFHGISLIVDIYRRSLDESTTQRLAGRGPHRWVSMRDVALYILFFPQLVAGPIVKAREFVGQIGQKFWCDIDWLIARRCLVLGYFLKIFVADNLAEQTTSLTLGAERLRNDTFINLMALLYSYSLQIFADFAGYSLIAIGLARLFGYRLPDNFKFPYLAVSITDFWRRWHLSLSSWLRDYLYVPLGGSRAGLRRTYLNLFIVMFLGGLWHGAAWKFVLWGCLHGLLLALERAIGIGESGSESISAAKGLQTRPCLRRSVNILRSFLTFNLVTVLWLTFLMPDLASVVAFLEGVFRAKPGFNGPPIFSLALYGTPVLLYHAWGRLCEAKSTLVARLQLPVVEATIQGLMCFLILTNPGAPRGFIYFQF